MHEGMEFALDEGGQAASRRVAVRSIEEGLEVRGENAVQIGLLRLAPAAQR